MSRRLSFVLLLLVLAPADRAPQAGEPDAAAMRVGLVRLAQEGAYRIGLAQLREIGIPSAARAVVLRAGRPVPIRRNPADVGPQGGIVFLADAVATPHSRWAVFELMKLASDAAPDDARPPEAPRGWILARRVAPDRVLGSLGAARSDIYARAAPVWFMGMAPAGQAFHERLDALGAAPGSAQTLAVDVYTTWHGPLVLEATWGGHSLGRAEVAGAVGGAVLQWAVPAQAVPSSAQPLVLQDRSPAPPPAPARDVSAHRGTVFIDALRLEGPGTRLAAFEQARAVQVRPVGVPRDPLRTAGDARHVVLATPPLLEGARALAAHRSRHGIPSAAVPVLDVYDRYGHGEHHPAAIRHFLADLAERPQTALDYVLLAGDATYDRTDLAPEATIPVGTTRSMYNGATASDRLYLPPTGATRIGRLPFRTAEEMQAYVARVVRYETRPPADVSRRLLRFITSEGRFSPLIDRLIETKFRNVLARRVPPAYDIEVTYANPRSPFLWPPPELAAKVIDTLNAGSLFYTYVGHGFEKGFDTLRVGTQAHRILHVDDVDRVDVQGTPPVMFVLACTTAMFDGIRGDGIGEALLKRSGGPVAYWGASRICHPVYNAYMGEAIARTMGQGGDLSRIGQLLAHARGQAPALMDAVSAGLLRAFAGIEDLGRLFAEGALMYTLLGDPALRIAFPREDVGVGARFDAASGSVEARITADLPIGTVLHVSLETPRNRDIAAPESVADPSDPASFEVIRRNHARVNDRALARADVVLEAGGSSVRLALSQGVEARGLVVKAWCIADGDVHQGAFVLP